MTRPYKIALSAVFIIIIALSVLIGSGVVRGKLYARGFAQVETGQQKQTVVNLMGDASEIRRCGYSVHDADKNYTADCFEILNYRAPFENWAVAFDKDGKVIEKYYWFLGEYGNRPPNLN